MVQCQVEAQANLHKGRGVSKSRPLVKAGGRLCNSKKKKGEVPSKKYKGGMHSKKGKSGVQRKRRRSEKNTRNQKDRGY